MNQLFLSNSSRYFKMAILLFIFAWVFSSQALGAEPTYLITYGPGAGTVEGDDDFSQVIFIKLPGEMRDTLYIRIFDADCGGKLDAKYSGSWDTKTRFRLFGGNGAYSIPGIKKPTPTQSDLVSGNLLADEEFGEEPYLDNQWHTFASIRPEDGERVGSFIYFKIVVEGKEGNDGNTFLLAVFYERALFHPYPAS